VGIWKRGAWCEHISFIFPVVELFIQPPCSDTQVSDTRIGTSGEPTVHSEHLVDPSDFVEDNR